MTRPVTAIDAAREAEAISRDSLSGFRDALIPRKGKHIPPMSMAEREAWACLRSIRRLIVETVKMQRTPSWYGGFDLDADLEWLHEERSRALTEIRQARYAAKRMETCDV